MQTAEWKMKYYEVTFKVISSPTQLDNANKQGIKKNTNSFVASLTLSLNHSSFWWLLPLVDLVIFMHSIWTLYTRVKSIQLYTAFFYTATKHQKCTHKLAKLIWSISACMWIVEIILQELLGKHYDDFKVFHQQFGKYAQPSVHDSCINVRNYMYWMCFFFVMNNTVCMGTAMNNIVKLD